MPEDPNFTKTEEVTDPLIVRLTKEKTTAIDFQKRRHDDWNDNYQLARNKVHTNRLTQRQAVNIPLMKETLKTLLSKIDDPPTATFKELGGDRQKELILQTRWEHDADRLNFEGIDIQDKKTVLLYGRGFKKLNFIDGEFDIDALDIFDVVVDPLTNPLSIETARFLCHQNIFRSYDQVMANKKYTGDGKKKLKAFMQSDEGIIQSQETEEQLEAKQERLKLMGVEEDNIGDFPAGATLLNLTEHYTWLWDKSKKMFVRYIIIYANNRIQLLKKPMKDIIGVDFLPFITWGEDIESQDFWSDGPADLVRTPNKVLNIFLSQMIENRTLKNFQMNFYDASIRNWQPQTYEPGPGRWIPVHGDPSKVTMPVPISGLEDTLTQIEFLTKLIERGTSATAIEKGVSEKKQITLGEVEMLVGKAMERTLSMAKFYRRAWKELAMKYWQILEANDNKPRTLYKTSGKGNVWPKKVHPKDWKSVKGYKVEVQSTSEQEAEKTSGIQKMFAVKNQFPNNRALNRIIQRRSLELIDLTPEELKEVEEEEKRMAEMPMEVPVEAPEKIGEEEQMAQQLQRSAGELAGLTARV